MRVTMDNIQKAQIFWQKFGPVIFFGAIGLSIDFFYSIPIFPSYIGAIAIVVTAACSLSLAIIRYPQIRALRYKEAPKALNKNVKWLGIALIALTAISVFVGILSRHP
jgi:hypothetical protein